MSDNRTLFKEHRPNELHPDLLATTALNPFPGQISASRLQMFNSHIAQALIVDGRTPRRCQTGLEAKFGEYVYGDTLKHPTRLIKSIPKFHKRVGESAIRENPSTTLIVEYEKETVDGRIYKEVDYLDLKNWHEQSTGFGFQYDHPERPKDYMPEGYSLSQSPSVDNAGNYCFGLEANVAMMSVPQVTEDGVVVSESFCRRTTTMGIQTYSFHFGKEYFPLNLYGDEVNYKSFPDVGDYVNDDGILVALRRYDELTAPVTMAKEALKDSDFKYDKCTYVPKGAKVVDVRVYHDTRLKISRGKRENTPPGMTRQTRKYLEAEQQYYAEVLKTYKEMYANQKEALRITPRFNRLLVEAHGMVNSQEANDLHRTYRGAPIDEWRVEVTLQYPIEPTIGFKITGCHGDKGVIVDVLPDEDMPVDADGNRAEIIMDGMSTINRMNISRLTEQSFNAASRDVTKRLQDMHRQGMSHKEMSRYLLGYYKTVSPKMAELVVDDRGEVSEKHLQTVLQDGIYLWTPTDSEVEPMDALKDIWNHYRPTYGPVTYRGMSGEFRTTTSNVLIGSMYIMLLEKTGKNWSAVSVSKLNHFGAPAKLTSTDRNNAPTRVQPIRFGESEARLFTATAGGVATANLFDRTNNPFVRKMVQEKILRADRPTDIDNVVDRQVYPNGQGRILSLIRHIGECAGYRFVRKEDGNE